MADIELVIKLSKDLYEDIKVNGLCGYSSDREAVSKAIVNGIPLPKGHGRLIDADETLFRHCEFDCKRKPYCLNECNISDLFRYANTIIEADKAESEE